MYKKTIALAVLAAISSSAYAFEENSNHMFRIGVAHVSPNDDSGTILGGGVGVESDTGIGLTYTYHWDQNWGVEVLASLPFTHDIVGTGALDGVAIGETKHLPPTVSLVYQWGEETMWHVGAGINYTKFFEEEAASDLNTALNAQAELSLDASTGFAVKFGFDTPINEDWYFNGSLYYIGIDTTADVIVNDAVAASVDVDIDPWVLMFGVGTSF